MLMLMLMFWRMQLALDLLHALDLLLAVVGLELVVTPFAIARPRPQLAKGLVANPSSCPTVYSSRMPLDVISV